MRQPCSSGPAACILRARALAKMIPWGVDETNRSEVQRFLFAAVTEQNLKMVPRPCYLESSKLIASVVSAT
jgi:hypothetical protein